MQLQQLQQKSEPQLQQMEAQLQQIQVQLQQKHAELIEKCNEISYLELRQERKWVSFIMQVEVMNTTLYYI